MGLWTVRLWTVGIESVSFFLIVMMIVQTAGSQNRDPVQEIGKSFHTILRFLETADQAENRVEVLQEALGKLEDLKGRVWKSFRNHPDRQSERERITFHLSYMIKWVRFLIQKNGAIPEPIRPTREQNEYKLGLKLLEQAKTHARKHPEDRVGIVNRFLKTLPYLKGKPEEREVVNLLNRIWGEVSPEGNLKSGSKSKAGSEPEAKPGKSPPSPGSETRTHPDVDSKKSPTPEILKQLREDLLGGSPAARIRAAGLLTGVNQSWVGKFLVQRLAEEKDPEVRKSLVTGILKIGNRHVVLALGKWNRLKDKSQKQQAIRLIGKVGGKEAGKALTLFLNDKDRDTILLVLKTAEHLKKGRGVPTLARAVKQFPDLRFEIIQSLGCVQHSSAAKVLISFLHRRKFQDYKDPAIKALRILGVYAIPPLIEALGGRDYRQYAAAALRSVTGQRFGMSYSRWQQWWKRNRKRLEAGER